MKPLSFTGKVLIAFALPLAVGYYFLVLPQMKTSAQVLADINSLRDVTTAGTTAKEREDFKKELEEVRAAALKLMPATSEQYDISVQVEDLAKSKGLTITALGVNAAQPTNIPKTTPAKDDTASTGGVVDTAQAAPAPPAALKVTITLGVSGTYDQLKELVEELPTLDRFIQIDTVQIATGGPSTTTETTTETTTAKIVTGQITATAYYLPTVK